MSRVVKAPEERRLEIIEVSERLFREIGYGKCSVDRIIREIGVAKGTFYYYFKSKPDILQAIVDRALDRLIEQAEQVADHPGLSAMDKMRLLLSGSHIGDESTEDLAEMMHLPENRELHEITNVQTLLRLSPVIARIVEQGNLEGAFSVAHPLATVQLLLAGGQFLLDGGLFAFSDEEIQLRRKVLQSMIETSFGAAPGSFAFMTPLQDADVKGERK